MKKTVLYYKDVLKTTFKNYMNSNVFIESSGLAYSAIFSVPGLLIIIIWLAGLFFGEDVVRGELFRQFEDALGSEAAKSIQNIITEALIDKKSFWMKIIGVAALVFGATTLFFMLQKTLNNLWEIEPKPKKAFVKYLTDRANSLGIIIVVSLLMTITMMFSTIIAACNHYISTHYGVEVYALAQVINFGVGFLLVMAVFSIIFKVLPDVEIQWRAVFSGAFMTTILFTIGKALLSIYFTKYNPTSVYGTAGTVVLIMMWINYSFLIILFGAEFTKVNALKKGYQFAPSDHAVWDT